MRNHPENGPELCYGRLEVTFKLLKLSSLLILFPSLFLIDLGRAPSAFTATGSAQVRSLATGAYDTLL